MSRGFKYCPECKIVQDEENFYTRKYSSGTVTLYRVCKPCHNDRVKEQAKKNTHKKREAQLKFKFNLTLEMYDEILKSQGGLCAICHQSEKIEGRQLAVDHNHHTGMVRGLLCHSCNTGLGKFKDSPELLKQAIKYLDAEFSLIGD